MDDLLPIKLQEILNASRIEQEFVVPVDYWQHSEKELLFSVKLNGRNENEFSVADMYFANTEQAILSKINVTESEDKFFVEQEQHILSQVRLLATESKESFDLPEGYFDQQAGHIMKAVARSERKGKIISFNLRLVVPVAAAACVILGLFIFWPTTHRSTESFASMLDHAELEVEDLEYFATEEDYYELFFNETGADTLSIDTLGKSVGIKEIHSEPVKLDPRTGLPLEKGIKPLDAKSDPTWDDITDEDFMKYLMEDSDDELIDDMN